MENYGKLNWLGVLALPALLATAGCDGLNFSPCKPNATRTAQAGCTCGCTNNSNAPECHDPNNVCCYDPNGACKTTTTTTPAPSSSTAPAMPPANSDGVRATLVRCFEEKDACTSAYPVLACQKFFERARFVNLSNAQAPAPSRETTPQLAIGAPLEINYDFSFPPKQVPWMPLDPGATQEVATEIRANSSAGVDGPGLDPGVQKCQQSASFNIQLINARPVEDPNGQVFEQVMIDGTADQPFGLCTKGAGC